jgi:hypothetical protein
VARIIIGKANDYSGHKRGTGHMPEFPKMVAPTLHHTNLQKISPHPLANMNFGSISGKHQETMQTQEAKKHLGVDGNPKDWVSLAKRKRHR